jgi:7-cyano-7-deazaguanine synthase
MKAIVLLSGGLDSTVMLAQALNKGRECIAITYDYQQRREWETHAAKKIASFYQVFQKLIVFDMSTFARSPLPLEWVVPKNRNSEQIHNGGIPTTYIHGRNTLFLAYAQSQAELYEAEEIYFGVNVTDRKPYPDTRPVFLDAFQSLLDVGTKQAVEGKPPKLCCPLMKLPKRDIVKLGCQLKAPLELTLSCYDPSPEGQHCGRCDACYLRKEGFIAAHRKDPTEYLEQGLPLEAAGLHDGLL